MPCCASFVQHHFRSRPLRHISLFLLCLHNHTSFPPVPIHYSRLRYAKAMATINLSINGPSIQSSYRSVVNSPLPSGSAASSPTYAQWAVFSVSAPLVSAFQSDGAGKESVLKVQETGGEFLDSIQDHNLAPANSQSVRGRPGESDRGILRGSHSICIR